jgi:O-methyltransferase
MMIKAINKLLGLADYKIVRKTIRVNSESVPANDISKSDFTDFHRHVLSKISPFTMTSPERVFGVIESVKYIAQNNIEGDIVECGVWKGGSMMAAALTLLECGQSNRKLLLFDTFEEGMTEPTSNDLDYKGSEAKAILNKWEETNSYPTLEIVRQNLYATGYPKENLIFIKGKVEETLHMNIPQKIALLRLDTDWYESTKLELELLFPKVVQNGVMIIDDYGHWKGARKAVDEYLASNKLKLFLSRMDYTGRITVKTTA